MNNKVRIDVYLFENNYYDSREKAKRAVMAGDVIVNGEMIDKAGTLIEENSNIEIKEKEKYVSRGGYKLEKAVETFQLTLTDFICMDIGASTGGFTDCMLQKGAKKVYAVDVGYGQLDWKLRNDERIVIMERTNFRNIDISTIKDKFDFFSVDVSFISLKHMFPNISKLSNTSSVLVTLIKPQFEAGREKVGKHGVVKNKDTHVEVINNVIAYAKNNGFYCHGITNSPIKGAKGNIEYLTVFKNFESSCVFNIEEIVNITFNELSN